MYLVGYDRFEEFAFEIPSSVVTYGDLAIVFPFLQNASRWDGSIPIGYAFNPVPEDRVIRVGDWLWGGQYTIEEETDKPLCDPITGVIL